MTSVRPGPALLLVSASAAFMAGAVFLANLPRYGAIGAVGGAILVVLGVGLGVIGFRGHAAGREHDRASGGHGR